MTMLFLSRRTIWRTPSLRQPDPTFDSVRFPILIGRRGGNLPCFHFSAMQPSQGLLGRATHRCRERNIYLDVSRSLYAYLEGNSFFFVSPRRLKTAVVESVEKLATDDKSQEEEGRTTWMMW